MTYYKILKVKHTSLKKKLLILLLFSYQKTGGFFLFVQKLARNFLPFSSYLCNVATQFEKIWHFEKKIQSALNLGQNQRTLNYNKILIVSQISTKNIRRFQDHPISNNLCSIVITKFLSMKSAKY